MNHNKTISGNILKGKKKMKLTVLCFATYVVVYSKKI
jgi:hypothetical protein